MIKPSFNKVIATIGVLFITLIVWFGPMFTYLYLLYKNPPLARQIVVIFAWYYFKEYQNGLC